jgi:tRNA A37 threonylcarbamoyladenosine biosynthesis protein TsaE
MADHANKAVVMEALGSLVRVKVLRAISLSGPWGVGKTHLVHEFAKKSPELLREAKLKAVRWMMRAQGEPGEWLVVSTPIH